VNGYYLKSERCINGAPVFLNKSGIMLFKYIMRRGTPYWYFSRDGDLTTKHGDFYRVQSAQDLPPLEGWVAKDCPCGEGTSFPALRALQPPEPSPSARERSRGREDGSSSDSNGPDLGWMVLTSPRARTPTPPRRDALQAASLSAGLDSGFTTFEVKCVRLVQPLEENHSASSIGLDRWDGATWVRVKTFLNTGGVEAAGRFLDLTVDEDSKWRLRPLKSQAAAWVDAPWSVQEWQLFPDVECSGSPLTARFVGASFQGNGSAWDGANPPSRAQDGLLDTGWASYCTGADVSGCEEGTWLEAQLHTAAVVRCMR
ncbi:unnamed protein product, partial [Effrenium voratum]